MWTVPRRLLCEPTWSRGLEDSKQTINNNMRQANNYKTALNMIYLHQQYLTHDEVKTLGFNS